MEKKSSKLLEGLNAEQIAAATHKDGPLLIVAGAGTGKTTVITRRIAWLIEQKLAKPSEILALTFTEKAATEMEERVDRLLPYGYLDLWISTFHSFGRRILEQHALEIGLATNFKVLTTTELWVLLRQNFEKFELDYYRPLGNPTRFIHALIKHFSRAKDEMVTPESYLQFAKELTLNQDNDLKLIADEQGAEAVKTSEVANAFATYQKLLRDSDALDFGDLINFTIELFNKRPGILEKYRRQFKYILVDEFQDTNFAQFELVKILAAPKNNLTVVGDDDQSIYKFRGASVSNILKFQDAYAASKQLTLTQNYRSYQNLLNFSYKFIQANNPERLEVKLKISKKLDSNRKGKGDVEYLEYTDQHAEAEATAKKIIESRQKRADATWNDFAILVRANDTAEVFLEALERFGVPYIHLSRRGLYHKPIIADLLSYFRLLDNYHESQALYRVLNLPKFKFGHEDLAKILDYSHRKTYSLYEALTHAGLVAGLTKEGQSSARLLMDLISKHTTLARTRPVNELFVRIVADLNLGELGTDLEAQQVENFSLLDQFNRKIKDFLVASQHKRLKDFLDEIALEQTAGDQGDLEFDPNVGPEAVKVITVHSAKGLEFPYVFLPALADKKFPATNRGEQIELPEKLVKDILPSGDVHLQEERRLFYVAMTRARDGLCFSYAKNYGGSSTRKPSVFLKELGLQKTESAGPTGKVDFKKPAANKRSKLPQPASFSFSSISAFRGCPLEYKYSYLLKIPQPGSAALSFGQTVHRTLEHYLKLYMQQAAARQGDLFAAAPKKTVPTLPAEQKFLDFFQRDWIDDWYEDKFQKERYRRQGAAIIKNLYQKFLADMPRPKYLEKPFKLQLGKHLLTGKIDRADEAPGGMVIIDYKTGADRPLDKVDREQLLIYQWAMQDYLREKVADLQYWFLRNGIQIKSFLGSEKQLVEVKSGLLDSIEKILDAAKHDSFEQYHKKHINCRYTV